jgi:hypothetical protein
MTGLIRAIVILIMVYSFSAGGVTSAASENPEVLKTGVLYGQFKKDRYVPLSNARLYIYNKAMGPPSADRHVRVPDQLDNTDGNGKFSLELPPGTYYVTARVVPESGQFGPPAIGEKVYYKRDSKGQILPFVVKAGKRTNAGVISTSASRKPPEEQGASIEGVVIDSDGVPVEGAVIYAYDAPEVLDRALFVSGRTLKDGKFLLRVKDGGTYYLRVRGTYGGGTPRNGEIVNLNDPKALVSVEVKKGEKLTGVSIQSKRLNTRGMLFRGQK